MASADDAAYFAKKGYNVERDKDGNLIIKWKAEK